MKRKRIFLILISLLLVFTCFSCDKKSGGKPIGEVTISIRCDTLSFNEDNYKKLDVKLQNEKYVPKDAVILAETKVEIYEGDSVFTVFKNITKSKKIERDYETTPGINTVFIKSINNLTLKASGSMSGWMYKVNELFPKTSCNKYILKDGDAIIFCYTCDNGKDVGDIIAS